MCSVASSLEPTPTSAMYDARPLAMHRHYGMHDPDLLLSVQNLKTHFFTREGVVRSVDGVSFGLRAGQTLGVVGESGCGKSITAKSVLRIVERPGRIVDG